jgi:uncharacterized protein (UPF0216 family)
MTSFNERARAEASKYQHMISPKAQHKYNFGCGAGSEGNKGFQPGNTCGGDGDGKDDAGDQGGGDKNKNLAEAITDAEEMLNEYSVGPRMEDTAEMLQHNGISPLDSPAYVELSEMREMLAEDFAEKFPHVKTADDAYKEFEGKALESVDEMREMLAEKTGKTLEESVGEFLESKKRDTGTAVDESARADELYEQAVGMGASDEDIDKWVDSMFAGDYETASADIEDWIEENSEEAPDVGIEVAGFESEEEFKDAMSDWNTRNDTLQAMSDDELRKVADSISDEDISGHANAVLKQREDLQRRLDEYNDAKSAPDAADLDPEDRGLVDEMTEAPGAAEAGSTVYDQVKEFMDTNPTEAEIESFYINEIQPQDKRSINEILQEEDPRDYETRRKEIDDKLDSGEISADDAHYLIEDLDAAMGMGEYAPAAEAPGAEGDMPSAKDYVDTILGEDWTFEDPPHEIFEDARGVKEFIDEELDNMQMGNDPISETMANEIWELIQPEAPGAEGGGSKYTSSFAVQEKMSELDTREAYPNKTYYLNTASEVLGNYINKDGSIAPEDYETVVEEVGSSLVRAGRTIMPPMGYEQARTLVDFWVQEHPTQPKSQGGG